MGLVALEKCEMAKIAFKSELGFEPSAVVDVAAAAAEGIYETPDSMAPTLGYMAYLSYKPAEFAFLIRLNQASAAGAGTIKLMAGDTELASQAVDLTAAQEIGGKIGVDLTGVGGAQLLKVVLDTATAADASTVATITGKLWIEQPLVISGCA